jgi:moderate conductance mechanosensitive channel
MALCRILAAVSATPDEMTNDAASAGSDYAPVLRRGIHIAVTIGGLLVIGRIWGLDLFDLTARRMGARPSEALLSSLVTLLVAHLAWDLARTAIDRRLARIGGPAADDAPSRLRTILPLVRGFFFVTICTMTVMIVLASLGVNIGPLLAGAGVVGIAVGFGAQTLVRDIVSGLFFLMDDSFRHGEYVDVGDVKGTVEKIGLRSMQLRHHRGALNTVPYGMIRRLVNESRDWTIVKLEFRLAYGADIGKIKGIFKRIGEELQAEPELAEGILEPLKSQGVIATEESGLIVQAKFKARPGDLQYIIRREAYDRILKAFAANGIRFAQRQVAVSVPRETGPESVPSFAAAAADGLTSDQRAR